MKTAGWSPERPARQVRDVLLATDLLTSAVQGATHTATHTVRPS